MSQIAVSKQKFNKVMAENDIMKRTLQIMKSEIAVKKIIEGIEDIKMGRVISLEDYKKKRAKSA